MPVTAIKTTGKNGELLRIQFITTPIEEKVLHVDVYLCNEEWIPNKLEGKKTEKVDEETYHRTLRDKAVNAGEFIQSASTNPEWSPGYKETEEKES